jgi:hypothetical protein
MISSDNLALNNSTNDEDFTYSNYRELLKMAKSGWKILDYRNIEWAKKFIVWRHDVDYSLNCSLKLAKVEQEEGVKATYFINPHSEFYNIAELSQYRIMKEILACGHDLGLHFDAAFHEIKSESELNALVAKESSYLEDLFGVKPTAFSFHNPVSKHLECEADEYGGLKNCYSKRFKEAVGYCSDSNGYWRFRRLYEVLKERKDSRLQVLTHPGWWQDICSPPRQRIYRIAYGRAKATMNLYDQTLNSYGRINLSGISVNLSFIRTISVNEFEICDNLLFNRNYEILLINLWRLFNSQLMHYCKLFVLKEWGVSEAKFTSLLMSVTTKTNIQKIFEEIFHKSIKDIASLGKDDLNSTKSKIDLLIRGEFSLKENEVLDECNLLCKSIANLIDWTSGNGLCHSNLDNLKLEGKTTYNISAWDTFKSRILQV